MLSLEDIKIEWSEQASFRISDSRIICIDPYNVGKWEKVDIILITHPHYDHCSISDITKLVKDDTVILAPPDCKDKLTFFKGEIKIVKPNMNLDICGVEIETIPAYNITKSFHPKGKEWVGYVIKIDTKRIYHAGDTDLIQEMYDLKDIDLALLPVGGTYTMDANSAAKVANAIRPKIAIPMHYGTVVGKREDAVTFRDLCKVKVEIL
ncbi:MAG: MBL fold metallo-hydrolase [bacterium]|nr:MBL fold metallo-hydrolase [bacterium]